MNSMRDIKIDKVVVNIGVGEAGEKLIKAERVLELLTSRKPVRTLSSTTNKDLGIRKDMPIGCKVTLRGDPAKKVRS
jgi:large subunit ribosomal protein L5